MGEVLNNYELLEPFQNQNAGFSRWTIARKKGKFYFIKQFLSLVYPIDDTLSESLISRRIKACEKYEEHYKKFYEAIGNVADGNIVKIHEFFRVDSHYYITTERINGEVISFEEIAALDIEDKVLLCRTLAHCLMQIHRKNIIHADIKADNVMIKETPAGKFVCKLIDFDCGFFEEEQPKSDDELCGDQVYLSPEACLFICGETVKLTTKIDVFAAGLLFHQYLTGKMPEFDTTEYDYAHEAVLDGQELKLSDDLPDEYRNLIARMLLRNPEERCDMEEVFLELGGKLEESRKEAREEVLSTKSFFMVPEEGDLL